MKKLKPKAYSMGCSGYEILYKCPKCSMKFNLANEDWHYCPCCGQALDWGVIVESNEEWKQKFLDVLDNSEKKKVLLSELDKQNTILPQDIRYKMQTTPATRKAIIKSNISYYLTEGWSKQELIKQGFFTEEDFKLYEEE